MVRRGVDADPSPGQYLLTGSATPAAKAPTHSGAGRIVQIRMRPLSFSERGRCPATVSVAGLLTGGRPAIDGDSPLTLPDYVQEILASGFPGIRSLPESARRAQLDGYLARVVDRDFPEHGHPVRRPASLRAWLTAYAAATATSASYNTILNAATPGEGNKPAKTTIIGYRDVLTQLWLLDPVDGWSPSRSALTRLQEAPKHHLADPGLAAMLLGATQDSLLAGEDDPTSLREGTLLGALFESLVALSVRVAAQNAEASTWHLRTGNGDHEVDIILQRADHKVVALEVKLAGAIGDKDTVHLRWLAQRLGSDLLDAAIVTTGQHACRRADGIAVIPLALLGP
jgi:predicted AAA+ superfamily ATPase